MNYRLGSFTLGQFDCAVHFSFPVIKLLDFADAAATENNNPFSIVTRVQLAKLKSENNSDKRYSFRMELTKELYKKQYSREDIIRLYRFIDYILKLPKPKVLQFKKELAQFEEVYKMPYITSTERLAREEGIHLGIEQGIVQGIVQGVEQGVELGIKQGVEQGKNKGQIINAQAYILKVLEIRFNTVPEILRQQILFCGDLNKLDELLQNALIAASLSELELLDDPGGRPR